MAVASFLGAPTTDFVGSFKALARGHLEGNKASIGLWRRGGLLVYRSLVVLMLAWEEPSKGQ